MQAWKNASQQKGERKRGKWEKNIMESEIARKFVCSVKLKEAPFPQHWGKAASKEENSSPMWVGGGWRRASSGQGAWCAIFVLTNRTVPSNQVLNACFIPFYLVEPPSFLGSKGGLAEQSF